MENIIPIAVTIPVAVSITGMSRSRLYQELKAGKLLAKKAGKRTLINVSDLQAYMAKLPTWTGA